MTDSSPHKRLWFSPHGTEWEAKSYEEALEMERDSLVEQYAKAEQEAETLSDLCDALRAERDSLVEQYEGEKAWGRNQADLLTECATENARLLEQLQATECQRDLAQREADMYKADRDEYDALLGRKMAERDGLLEQLQAAERECGEAWTEYNDSEAEKTRLLEQLEALQLKLDQIWSEADSAIHIAGDMWPDSAVTFAELMTMLADSNPASGPEKSAPVPREGAQDWRNAGPESVATAPDGSSPAMRQEGES